ncbi:hypothetical protein [Sphingobacterium psychroaquaticum]|uniref:Mu-like prophage I protein n=1 Tax=Sphingobacterium psychroaquaticum TaxID=561061 RepID=A0A1X7K406_9SPHI|nr:hypothetical protein [Sphingobacterium psychroaquaticum]SMG35530.1 hypothetical protein SAMN05660862_2526 [Sphingobacterium psychroaquaticum]
MSKRVVLSDQSIPNYRGFYVDHSTLDMSRFEHNPILLYMHIRGEVHGKWEDWKFEGSQLTATPDFDTADPDSNKIAGKWERGYLKGASLYLYITDKTEFIQDEQGRVWMKHAQVWEASIVDIPGNQNSLSVTLFADGKQVDDEQVKAYMLSASKHADQELIPKNKKNNMSKIITNSVALAALTAYGLTNADSPEEVEGAVVKLSTALKAEQTAHGLEKTQRESLEKKLNEQQALQLNALLDQAVSDGQIMGDKRSDFEALGFDAAKKLIDGLPKKVSLGAQVVGQGGASVDPKNVEEFLKLSTEAQLAFKNGNPTAYTALFA